MILRGASIVARLDRTAAIPGRVDLMQELVATSGFVVLADRCGGPAESLERSQEPTVRRLGPSDTARAAPTVLPEPVEPPVIPHPECRVGLDIVTSRISEACPGVEVPGPPSDDRADRGTARVAAGREGRFQGALRVRGLGVEHRVGRTVLGEVDGNVGHLGDGTRTLVVPAPGAAKVHRYHRFMAKPTPPARGTRLVLARHAVTAQTGPLLSGRTPGVDLSEAGAAQAAALGLRLAPLPVAAVFASPIERTTQTAEAVAHHHGLEVTPLAGVLEADYGEWTGKKISDLASTDLWKVVQRSPSRAAFPGGESLAAMQARIVASLEAVVADHPGQLVVVVSHADPIKSAIAHFAGTHLDLFQRIVVSPASVTVFEFSGHGVAMLKCNDTGSLDELQSVAGAA